MWDVGIRRQDDTATWEKTSFKAYDDKPPEIADVAQVAEKLREESSIDVPLHLINELASEESPVPGADGIAHWGGSVVGDFIDSNEKRITLGFDHDIGAILLTIEGNESYESAVIQDMTTVIVPIPEDVEEIKFEYDDAFSQINALSSRFKDATPKGNDATISTYFEWRIYTGTESGIFDGTTSFISHAGKRIVRIAAEYSGILVGTVVHHYSRGPARPTSDFLSKRRLASMEKQYPVAAEKYPRLDQAMSGKHECIVILVHGTFSCGMKMAHELESHQPTGNAVYRYEHDTFKQINDNAVELAKLVKYTGCKRALFVAHSRGGLVACSAAIHLSLMQNSPETKVWTFGTPHNGTPLVEVGRKSLGWLYRLGTETISDIPMLLPLHWATCYLLRNMHLPPGVMAMNPCSPFLATHQGYLPYIDLETYSGWINPGTTKKTVAGLCFIKGLSRKLFGGMNNDLVVTVQSSTFSTSEHELEDCSHTHYFMRRDIRKKIEKYQCSASLLGRGEGNISSKTPIIIEHDDYVDIDGLKLERDKRWCD